MKTKVLKFLLPLVILTNSGISDCYIGCDNIYRNLSTDFAKVVSYFKDSGFKLKEDNYNKKLLCYYNDVNELEIVYIEKNINKETLTVTLSQFSPPKLNGNKWKPTKVGIINATQTQKILSFGLSGIIHGVSEDQRCITGDSKKMGTAILCLYGKNENLPATIKRLKNELSLNAILSLGSENVCK